MPTGSTLKRDFKENIRLSKIAGYLNDIKKLRELLADNQEHYNFLIQFLEMPMALLEKEGVSREFGQKVLVENTPLTPKFLESFRQTRSLTFAGTESFDWLEYPVPEEIPFGKTCYMCKGTWFFKNPSNIWTCGRCHPPANNEDIKNLGGPPWQ